MSQKEVEGCCIEALQEVSDKVEITLNHSKKTEKRISKIFKQIKNMLRRGNAKTKAKETQTQA